MIKGIDFGEYSCLSASGKPKSRWDNDKEAIANAKYINETYPEDDSKLVPYKCPNCHNYHLTTKIIKKKW
jgi:hypothetical protein